MGQTILFAGVLMQVLSAGFAQTTDVSIYRTHVRTKSGQHLVGTLSEVTATYLYLDSEPIDLNDVRKVIVSRTDKRAGTLTGAVLGGISLGYLTNRSLQNESVSNGFLYGVSLVLGATAGAAAGAVVGSSVGKLSRAGRIVFRPRPGEEAVQSLSRQLKPFSRRYQEDLMNTPSQPFD